MKPKAVTPQMKAVDEYFLIVVFTLFLPNGVHVFANFMFYLDRETWQWKGSNSFCRFSLTKNIL